MSEDKEKEVIRLGTYDDTQQVQAELRKRETHLDAIRGSILGGAAGDALGYPVEFMSLAAIRAKYGEAGIQAYDCDPRSGKALISDDTQMTLFTATGIMEGDTRAKLRGTGGLPRVYVWYAYKAWYRTQSFEREHPHDMTSSWLDKIPEMYAQRAPGGTCLRALRGDVPGEIDAPINDSCGCGSVMRIAPLGLYYECETPELLLELDKEGAAIAALTHDHPLGYIPAAIMTHIVHEIVYSRGSYDSLKDIVLAGIEADQELYGDVPENARMIELMDLAIALSENDASDEENIRKLGEGWVAQEALAISVYCALRHQDDFSAGIIAAVDHDGDSDSTGAITGNILGAWLGFSAIEEKWKEDLELYDVILEVADDLCHGCQMEEYGRYRDPAWEAKYIMREPYKAE